MFQLNSRFDLASLSIGYLCVYSNLLQCSFSFIFFFTPPSYKKILPVFNWRIKQFITFFSQSTSQEKYLNGHFFLFDLNKCRIFVILFTAIEIFPLFSVFTSTSCQPFHKKRDLLCTVHVHCSGLVVPRCSLIHLLWSHRWSVEMW